MLRAGIKEYSDWPTIPQLYVDKEFVGGCDILMNMHKDGTLADLLSQKKVLVTEDEEPRSQAEDQDEVKKSTNAGGDKSGGDYEGAKATAARVATEQSTGARSKDAKGQSS